MRREETPTPRLTRDRRQHRERDRVAVRRGRPAPELVDDQQRSLRVVPYERTSGWHRTRLRRPPQRRGRLRHLREERAYAARDAVARADATRDGVDDVERGGRGGDVATALRHDHGDGDLAQQRRLSAHVGAGEEHARGGVAAAEDDVVAHEGRRGVVGVIGGDRRARVADGDERVPAVAQLQPVPAAAAAAAVVIVFQERRTAERPGHRARPRPRRETLKRVKVRARADDRAPQVPPGRELVHDGGNFPRRRRRRRRRRVLDDVVVVVVEISARRRVDESHEHGASRSAAVFFDFFVRFDGVGFAAARASSSSSSSPPPPPFLPQTRATSSDASSTRARRSFAGRSTARPSSRNDPSIPPPPPPPPPPPGAGNSASASAVATIASTVPTNARRSLPRGDQNATAASPTRSPSSSESCVSSKRRARPP
eukprot:31253-Pelagococcus_subviridis.AAC.4